MCGLNGILRLSESAPPVDAEELRRTRDAMATRGPDGEGLWLSPGGQLGLGHRRLAILDPSERAAQPMVSADGMRIAVLNGEIYNFRELRRELERAGTRFRTDSDTEVLLALHEREGAACLGRLRGMFALALWDVAREELLLARDPFGIKPLYYAACGPTLRFASQVRALLAGGALPEGRDPVAVAGFLIWGTVPEPHTLHAAIRALPAGHSLRVRRGVIEAPVPFETAGRVECARPGTQADALRAAFEASVAAHLVSDVPVALFLSAGLDSAMIAAVAARLAPGTLRTFTLAFEAYRGTPRDEAEGAEALAARLGTRHVTRRVSGADIDEAFEAALAVMDQPSIDGFNTALVSRVAHEEGIKVALSGLGGDEVLGGYPSFRDVPRWRSWSRALARLGLGPLWPGFARRLAPGRPKLAGLLKRGQTLEGAYLLRRALFLPEELPGLLGAGAAATALGEYDPVAALSQTLEHDPPPDAWAAVSRLELSHYTRPQLLRDSDWASMAHSLELRVPFLDRPLLDALQAAGSFPACRDKVSFARLVAPEIPESALRRPKSGFLVPLAERWEGAGSTGVGGLPSRRLALRVLRRFGVELDPSLADPGAAA